MNSHFDAIVIGGGASGLMTALTAARKNLNVAVLEHNPRFGLKILISGGGRCNFTNLTVNHKHYVSNHPNFCKFVLNQYTPEQFIQLVKNHKIPFHEKTLGQLFCDKSSKQILNMLIDECESNGVELITGVDILSLRKSGDSFEALTNKDDFSAKHLVLATGGLSFPKLGANPMGYKWAQSFGHKVTELEPALVPFTLDFQYGKLEDLAGIAIPCHIKIGKQSFSENLLWTHRGLSGPAILKASLYWSSGDLVTVNFLPELDLKEDLTSTKNQNMKLIKLLQNHQLPARFVELIVGKLVPKQNPFVKELSKKEIDKLSIFFNRWQFIPTGTEGFKKAEVTRGGIELTEVNSKTLESKLVPGLFFVGEILDVTGLLGGYNFQWAWASGHVVGTHLSQKKSSD